MDKLDIRCTSLKFKGDCRRARKALKSPAHREQSRSKCEWENTRRFKGRQQKGRPMLKQ